MPIFSSLDGVLFVQGIDCNLVTVSHLAFFFGGSGRSARLTHSTSSLRQREHLGFLRSHFRCRTRHCSLESPGSDQYSPGLRVLPNTARNTYHASLSPLLMSKKVCGIPSGDGTGMELASVLLRVLAKMIASQMLGAETARFVKNSLGRHPATPPSFLPFSSGSTYLCSRSETHCVLTLKVRA